MEPNLPNAEFAFPGPLRDALVAAILDGSKTSTTSVALQYDVDSEPLPVPGTRSVLVDSAGNAVAILEVTGVRLVPLGAVDLAHVLDEGEGHESVAQWRTAHEQFWHSAEFRSAVGNPDFTVDDTTVAVLERFRVVEVAGTK
jgi:uncharacterized protein YhfF